MDKEIIIDGVDVIRCKNYLDYTDKYDCKLGRYCKLNPNCYFKQLQRKEQECEELKAQRDTYINLTHIYKDLSKGRKDTKSVTNYIKGLETKLNKYKQALNEIKEVFEYDIEYGSGLHKQILNIINKVKENN